MRGIVLRHNASYLPFYKILGFCPIDLKPYQQACLHRSSSIRLVGGEWVNNERLEFLGDAVLGAVVADILYQRFGKKKEGFLTATRSKLVKRESMNKLAVDIGLDKLVVSATSHQNNHNSHMYGNALEAFIGAIYLDQGYDVCRKFVLERVITPHIDLKELANTESNFKSKLIEWTQKHRVEIEFRELEPKLDREKNTLFQTNIALANVTCGVACGYSKKESHQHAAELALQRLRQDTTFYKKVLAEAAKQRTPLAEGEAPANA